MRCVVFRLSRLAGFSSSIVSFFGWNMVDLLLFDGVPSVLTSSMFGDFGAGGGDDSGLGDSWKLEVKLSEMSSFSRIGCSGVFLIIDLRPPSHLIGVVPFLIGVAGGLL